ncbi:sulfatase [Carboxylicivirga marina]|uniref:Sulfatase n=1 Tax=Carboxylicivirga marina TaxID=2800988 RepID=A0ABS1HHL0_9BACT|nr:sulfatase [Carboxylicivirga marina]MBK3517106.1 sulfatase [Carboxylicivirga marina]
MKCQQFSFCLFLALSLLGTLNGCKNNERKLNVIVILVDDLGVTDLGCYGSDFYQTPHIDHLANEGIRFTNSYSSCTVCSPTRASIMTGKYPARQHLTDWIEGHKYPWAKLSVPDWTMYLDSAEHTMAETFKSAGYFTAHVGKWHLGENEKDWPENHGFDVNIAGWAKGAPHRNKQKGYQGYFSPYGNPRLEDGPNDEYLTERLTNEVCTLIEEQGDAPFFINFWLYNVHTPLQACQDKIDKYKALVDSTKHHQNPIYAAMVEHTDEAVGKVIAKLKEKGLYENTIILFSSDNGGLIGRKRNRVTSNYPFRHGKGGMHEGGVRIPTILYAPNIGSKKQEVDEPVISNDYYPTLAQLAGVSIPEKQSATMDGSSWMPLLNGSGELKREAIYWHYPHYHQQGAVPYSAIRMGDWKLIDNFETNKLQLYNLSNDIGESYDLSKSHPDKTIELKEKLDAWRECIDAQFPSENPQYNKKKERRKKN